VQLGQRIRRLVSRLSVWSPLTWSSARGRSWPRHRCRPHSSHRRSFKPALINRSRRRAVFVWGELGTRISLSGSTLRPGNLRPRAQLWPVKEDVDGWRWERGRTGTSRDRVARCGGGDRRNLQARPRASRTPRSASRWTPLRREVARRSTFGCEAYPILSNLRSIINAK